jgi:trans-aconitate methyltransferase
MEPDTQHHVLRADADGLLEQDWLRQALQQCHPFAGSPVASQDMLQTTIHSNCPMLAHSLRAHGHAGRAVSQYFAVGVQQAASVAQLLAQWPLPDAPSVFDFACGHGRLQRFLQGVLPASSVHVCDVQEDAIGHLVAHYGVQAVTATTNPDTFNAPRPFDVIWVASLFSHLPAASFDRWLQVLVNQLSPRGVLAFSVHDEALLPPDWVLPDEGLLYQAGSENAALDSSHYGTTFVSEARVAASVERAGLQHWKRYPRLLAHEQDVYLISAQPPTWPQLRLGPRGWLDRIERIGPQGWRLVGWAGSPEDGALSRLSVQRASGEQQMTANLPSPEVARVLQQPQLNQVGFAHEFEGTEGEWLVVIAEDQQGLRSPVYLGPLVADAN